MGNSQSHEPGQHARPLQVYAAVMWTLALLFALRVAGQAIQFWAPQPFLPVFGDFQGSTLPYRPLLLSQLVILGLMAHYTCRVQIGSLTPKQRTGTVLAWLGGCYMAGAWGRIAVGLFFPGASAWFRAWIPAVFHIVLASFVLTAAIYHAIESRRGGEDS